jgi:hypothetical protein
MRALKLITFSVNTATIGKLYDESGALICHTIERPWLQNRVNVSCIPAGTYDLKPVNSPKFGLTFEVEAVVGRTHILIHKANRPSELHGCIAPISKFGVFGNEWAGMSSKKAYDKLMSTLDKNEKHQLIIERN